ncbi:hypothetical protein JDV02_009744 [Purpureocillium takamizusanense]|uniref:2EXR domain-containing protein n=1 Tax=Purpureocillium takamizusanense TaxID=2060973 RepID=A0A9Q8VGM8_9HYPO|nr:uncharacterized protein JDV02_009744 [Purpureocillium takamizusanense]UNI23957.1 hypothetical protein JDV02_009744 [Purpureocillium takamizusanense]
MAATFHPFGRLPFELRARIWTLAVRARIVHVRYLSSSSSNASSNTTISTTTTTTAKQNGHHGSGGGDDDDVILLHVLSPTPAPAVLQACHEARNLGLYERAFADGRDPRYVWVNFDVDIISLGDGDFHLSYP